MVGFQFEIHLIFHLLTIFYQLCKNQISDGFLTNFGNYP